MKRHRDSQKTEPEHINVDAQSNIDLKFEFAGPKRTSDERHYFKAIKENYVEKLQNQRNKRGSLSDLVERHH